MNGLRWDILLGWSFQEKPVILMVTSPMKRNKGASMRGSDDVWPLRLRCSAGTWRFRRRRARHGPLPKWPSSPKPHTRVDQHQAIAITWGYHLYLQFGLVSQHGFSFGRGRLSVGWLEAQWWRALSLLRGVRESELQPEPRLQLLTQGVPFLGLGKGQLVA